MIKKFVVKSTNFLKIIFLFEKMTFSKKNIINSNSKKTYSLLFIIN